MKKPCPRYEAVFKEVENSPALKALERKYKRLLDHLTKYTGMSVQTIGQVESLYITLDIQRYHNLTLPSWVNDSMMADMKMLAARTLAYYSETEYMKRIRGGSFLKHVLRSMRMILNGQEEPLVNLYSAHDITLVHVLRSLHLVDDTVKPDYGAYLIFELYSDGEVKFKYSNSWDSKPDPTMILCTAPCKLGYLEETLKPMIPMDYDQECQLQMTSAINGSVIYSVWTSYVICIVTTVVIYNFSSNLF
nr:unnamed protein product [Callosobruchus analis]